MSHKHLEPVIHRHQASPEGALVNAYLVEVPSGVIAVDSTLTVSDSRALRRRVDETGKPLLAVLLTQSHPDHYGGLRELWRVRKCGSSPLLGCTSRSAGMIRSRSRSCDRCSPTNGRQSASSRTRRSRTAGR